MNEQPAVQMPHWKCHKEVYAAKITDISPQDANMETTLVFGDIGGRTQVTAEWQSKHKPEVGGYYVLYDDLYTSYSPAKAFEDGYTPIK